MNDYEYIILYSLFGSHLYGTNTTESDKDYKGIFLPTKEQIFLQRVPKSIKLSKDDNLKKNTKDNVDSEIYSLHYFIDLSCKGETVALDILHTPKEMIKSCYYPIWDFIQENRSRFYTKNLKSFCGYCRSQAAKYGLRGSRLSAAKEFLDFCLRHNKTERLFEYWDEIPINEHIKFVDSNKNNIRQISICSRTIQETVTFEYAYNVIYKFYENYGHRAKLAAENKGVDFKAISHAFRAAYQAKSIFLEGDIIYPLKEAEFLKQIKRGEFHYAYELSPMLEDLIDEVNELSNNSNLPEEVDRKFWDNFICNIIEKEINNWQQDQN